MLGCLWWRERAVYTMGWLWLVGSIKLQVSFAKETYKRDNVLQKRPIILSILLTVATPYLVAGRIVYVRVAVHIVRVCECMCVAGRKGIRLQESWGGGLACRFV